jgi:hypothetical protein
MKSIYNLSKTVAVSFSEIVDFDFPTQIWRPKSKNYTKSLLPLYSRARL